MTRLETAELGTVLGVWAHPDDEAYLSAGTMAALRAAGHRVVVATATCGERGTDDPVRWRPATLASLRRAELRSSLRIVGVEEHHWLGHADGACSAVPLLTGAAAVTRLLQDVRPDTILTFGPDGMTGHPDHRAVSAWTTAAWRLSGRKARLLYATLTPGFHAEWGSLNRQVGLWMSGNGPSTPDAQLAVHTQLTGAALDLKLAALRAHGSQVNGLLDTVGEDRFRRWWSAESFVDAGPARPVDLVQFDRS